MSAIFPSVNKGAEEIFGASLLSYLRIRKCRQDIGSCIDQNGANKDILVRCEVGV